MRDASCSWRDWKVFRADWWERNWQVVAAGLVFVVATISATQVVQPGGSRLGLLDAAYLALKLFPLNADGLPTGDPLAWRVVLTACCFLAPALFASILLQAAWRAWRILAGPERLVRRLRDHVILCGFGRHGRIFAQSILSKDGAPPMVIVDREGSLGATVEIELLGERSADHGHGHRREVRSVPVIRGEMTDPETLRAAGVERAATLLALSGSDAVNIHTCLLAKQIDEKTRLGHKLHVHALVVDHDLADAFKDSDLGAHWRFNPYEIAAKAMLDGDSWLDLDTDKTSPVILGFGRFGQMLALALLQPEGGGRPAVRRLWVVDRDEERKHAAFRHFHPVAEGEKDPIQWEQGDLRNINRVNQVLEQVRLAGIERPTVLLCTDDDAGNINTALLLARSTKLQPKVISRVLNAPKKFAELLEKKNVYPIQIQDLLETNMPECCCGKRCGAERSSKEQEAESGDGGG